MNDPFTQSSRNPDIQMAAEISKPFALRVILSLVGAQIQVEAN